MTYAAQQSPGNARPGGSGNRLLSEVDGPVGLVPLNGTRPLPKLGAAPHGGGGDGGKVVGLVNPELKHKVEQLVHISRKKRRRRRRRGVRGG